MNESAESKNEESIIFSKEVKLIILLYRKMFFLFKWSRCLVKKGGMILQIILKRFFLIIIKIKDKLKQG